MDSIETEILKLVKEIARGEVELRDTLGHAAGAMSDLSRNRYLKNAEGQENALNRKIDLLRILKS